MLGLCRSGSLMVLPPLGLFQSGVIPSPAGSIQHHDGDTNLLEEPPVGISAQVPVCFTDPTVKLATS